MRKNAKVSKIDKKETNYSKKVFLQKNAVHVVYLLRKSLKMKVHKMLEHQMNIYVSRFMKILLFQAYCKQNIRLT